MTASNCAASIAVSLGKAACFLCDFAGEGDELSGATRAYSSLIADVFLLNK